MISEILLLLSCGALGVFLGAQIVEAFLFVPFWKDMTPDDFFEFYKKYGDKIHRFFAPLTIAATFLPLIAVGHFIFNQTELPPLLIVMGISTAAFFSTFYLYFKKANKSFAERTISDGKLGDELTKWANWHWGRIFFEGVAFVSALGLLLM